MVAKDSQKQPFFTVVVRTQGTRQETLAEALLCLGSQTFSDYEVLLVCHSTSEARLDAVESLLSSFPEEFASKVRILQCKDGSRARPLNMGLEEGKGKYFAFLDDDDFVFSNWLEVFFDLSEERNGCVLRSQALLQHYLISKYETPTYGQAISDPWLQYNSKFSLVQHLVENQSPFMTLAFPSDTLELRNLRFDESLTTTEDWDFLLRCSRLVGVHNSEEPTAIYRKWENLDSSSKIAEIEWKVNHSYILQKINSEAITLQAGEVLNLQTVHGMWSKLTESPPAVMRQDNLEDLEALITTLESRSWRWTAWPRWIVGIFKRHPRVSLVSIEIKNSDQVRQLTAIIQTSFWFRITKPFRKKWPDRYTVESEKSEFQDFNKETVRQQ